MYQGFRTLLGAPVPSSSQKKARKKKATAKGENRNAIIIDFTQEAVSQHAMQAQRQVLPKSSICTADLPDLSMNSSDPGRAMSSVMSVSSQASSHQKEESNVMDGYAMERSVQWLRESATKDDAEIAAKSSPQSEQETLKDFAKFVSKNATPLVTPPMTPNAKTQSNEKNGGSLSPTDARAKVAYTRTHFGFNMTPQEGAEERDGNVNGEGKEDVDVDAFSAWLKKPKRVFKPKSYAHDGLFHHNADQVLANFEISFTYSYSGRL